jgi:hypothetical protein
VFARLERNEVSSYGRSKAQMQETFSTIVADLDNRVPEDVDLLYHLCYGDSNHRHVVEPADGRHPCVALLPRCRKKRRKRSQPNGLRLPDRTSLN